MRVKRRAGLCDDPHMATVPIDDDGVHRYVIRHRACSLAGGELRHRVGAVLDNQREWVETVQRLKEELDDRRNHGEDAEPSEDFTGLILEPGDLTREPTSPRALQVLRRGDWHLPEPPVVITGERVQE